MTCLSKMPILRCLQQQNCILCTGFKFTVTPFTGQNILSTTTDISEIYHLGCSEQTATMQK